MMSVEQEHRSQIQKEKEKVALIFFALLLRSKVSSSVVVSEQGCAEQAESHARGYGYAVIILTNDGRGSLAALRYLRR